MRLMGQQYLRAKKLNTVLQVGRGFLFLVQDKHRTSKIHKPSDRQIKHYGKYNWSTQDLPAAKHLKLPIEVQR